MNLPGLTLKLALLSVLFFPSNSTKAEIYLGSGAKAGEITDRTAIIHVRLTSTPGQNTESLIPGRAGQARLHGCSRPGNLIASVCLNC